MPVHEAVQSITRVLRGPRGAAVALALLLAAGLGLRLHFASSLSLGKDEALYWSWSRNLDASYAFVPFAAIRLSCSIFGDHAASVRLPFVLAATGAAVFLFAFARVSGLRPWPAVAAVALFTGTVWFHFTGSQAHPDSFLAFFWTGCLWAVARAVRPFAPGAPRAVSPAAPWTDGRLYAAAVFAAGAALSKYSGFLLWPACTLVALAGGRSFASVTSVSLRGLMGPTALWLVLVSPGLAAIAAEQGHWALVTFGLSDLGDRIPPPVRLALLPLAPLFALLAPGFVVYWIGLAGALARPGRAGAGWGWAGLLVAVPVVLAGMHGSIKGNWLLPAFWGTLPRGAARFAASRTGSRALLVLIGAGAAALVAVHAAALRPDVVVAVLRRVPGGEHLDRSYAATVSRQELRHATSRRWSDRLYEFHGPPAVADSIAERAARYASDAVVLSDLYEIVYPTRFYRRDLPLRLIEDERFRRSPEYLPWRAPRPARALLVTLPGSRLPESMFLRYRYLEREPALVVPVGRHGTRSYDVWRCGREEE